LALPVSLQRAGENGCQLSTNSWSYRAGAQFCLADGSVRLVSQNIDHNTYRAVCTRELGESLMLP
jgi:hypothetical protein